MYFFDHADIRDRGELERMFREHRPLGVLHLAAESHVDRSIDGPMDFVDTNVTGTCHLLDTALEYFRVLSGKDRSAFRFLQVSTDEVYGSLGSEGYFHEEMPYRPSSPYAASKASADHLARAWHRTYGLPVIITNCSNNYGPYQYPEKLIPLMVLNALDCEELPVYGAGENVRDWLYVEDHVRALAAVLEKGLPGRTYNVGGNAEKSNLEVVQAICDVLDRTHPRGDGLSYRTQIAFVADRPGHDFRYAIDASRIRSELGWRPKETFASGLEQTIEWYTANGDWCRRVQQGKTSRRRLGVRGA